MCKTIKENEILYEKLKVTTDMIKVFFRDKIKSSPEDCFKLRVIELLAKLNSL